MCVVLCVCASMRVCTYSVLLRIFIFDDHALAVLLISAHTYHTHVKGNCCHISEGMWKMLCFVNVIRSIPMVCTETGGAI